MESKLSERVNHIINFSKEEANRLKNRSIAPEHLLLGILREGEGKAIELLKIQNVDLLELKLHLEDTLKLSSDESLSALEDVPFNAETGRIMRISLLEARLLKDSVVDTEHLLLAILKDNNTDAANTLADCGVDYRKTR